MKSLTYVVLFLAVIVSHFTVGQETAPHMSVNKDPLILVNDRVLANEVLNQIDPKNIETLTVWKDEKAKALYGEKGKNGVIVMTTKGLSKKKLTILYQKYALEFTNTSNTIPFQLSGTVSDCEHVPIVGATLVNLNSKKETRTDFDGTFSLAVNTNDVVAIKFEGYQSKRVVVVSKKKLTIQLTAQPNDDKIRVAKPVIYLYPTKETEIDIQLNFKGTIATTFPKYDKNWEVIASPSGQLFDKKTKRTYSSLFWDGMVDFSEDHYLYDAGFVVTKEKLTDFFIEKLELIGLNPSETNDFIQYWLPIMEHNRYLFVHFLVNEACNEIATLRVDPKPDSVLRIYMEFYALEAPIQIEPQELPKIERKGFVLVEWGGADVASKIKK